MKPQRFLFRIHVADGRATVIMDCGEGVYRARSMPVPFLRSIADFCRRSDDILEPLRQDEGLAGNIPVFPGFQQMGSCSLGPCRATIVASKTPTGDVELSIAFYDIGDARAPALLLTEEQVQQFVRIVDALLRPGTDHDGRKSDNDA